MPLASIYLSTGKSFYYLLLCVLTIQRIYSLPLSQHVSNEFVKRVIIIFKHYPNIVWENVSVTAQHLLIKLKWGQFNVVTSRGLSKFQDPSLNPAGSL